MNIILFDVDGVFLSEERYFDASALCVWELLGSETYLGLNIGFQLPISESKIRIVRNEVFDSDRVLSFMKSRGINSNWDMVFLQVSYQLVRGIIDCNNRAFAKEMLCEPFDRTSLAKIGYYLRSNAITPNYAAFVADFQNSNTQMHDVFDVLNQQIETHFGIRCNFFKRNSSLWDICQRAFQEWYIGEEQYQNETGLPLLQQGKPGFLKDELVVAPAKQMAQLLQRLCSKGFSLGIATGRPRLETNVPLQEIGLLTHIDSKRIVTASDVLQVEQLYPEYAPLAKPHPFCFLKALMTTDFDDYELLQMSQSSLPLQDADHVWVVGDSLADYYAAKAIGCKFAATLTGLSGKAARVTFEKLNVDAILEDVLELDSFFP